MKKLSILLCVVCISMGLVGCTDDTYSGLYINENSKQLYDLCKVDSTFTIEECDKVATTLADKNFKKIKKVKELAGGTEKKILITDANDMSFIIFMSNGKVTGIQNDAGLSIYIRTITKEKKPKK